MIELGMMKVLFPQVKVLDKSLDRIGKAYFPAFLGVLLKDYKKDSGKIAQKVMKLSNEDADAVQCVTRMIWEKFSLKDPYKLVKFSMSITIHCIDSIDGYLLAIKKDTLSNMLNSIRRKGKPTNLKELPINGKDLMDLGIRGRDVGRLLDKSLELAIRGNLSRDELLQLAKRGT